MSVSETPDCDALVIGAGAGGLCAAARLSHLGYRTLLVESRDRVGGRASTVEEEGFLVNTGAVAIEYGGVLEETFRTVGAPFDIRVPEPATLFRLKGRNVDITGGGWGKLINGVTKKGAGLLDSLGSARHGDLPDEELTVKAWLSGFTKNKTIHALFRNLCAAIFAVNSDEMPAKAFLTYFIQKGAFRRFGFSPTGTLGLMRGLADVVEKNGEVWLDTSVTALHVEDGRVAGATLSRAGTTVEVRPSIVISNAGPAATVALCGREQFDADYLARMDRDLKATANIVVNVASREPLLDIPGIVTFGITRRLCNLANLTATCPELAPEGWHLAVAYGVPDPSRRRLRRGGGDRRHARRPPRRDQGLRRAGPHPLRPGHAGRLAGPAQHRRPRPTPGHPARQPVERGRRRPGVRQRGRPGLRRKRQAGRRSGGRTLRPLTSLEDGLRLRHEGHELAGVVADLRLQHDRLPPDMQRAGRRPGGTAPNGPHEVGLRLDGRRARAFREVQEGAHAAERVGQRHQRSAVEDPAGGAAVLPPVQVAPHLVRVCGVDFDPTGAGEGHGIEQVHHAPQSGDDGAANRLPLG